MAKRKQKSEPGLRINWVTDEVAHFVVETKNGPVHFGIKMQKKPTRAIRLLDPLRRVTYIPKP